MCLYRLKQFCCSISVRLYLYSSGTGQDFCRLCCSRLLHFTFASMQAALCTALSFYSCKLTRDVCLVPGMYIQTPQSSNSVTAQLWLEATRLQKRLKQHVGSVLNMYTLDRCHCTHTHPSSSNCDHIGNYCPGKDWF